MGRFELTTSRVQNHSADIMLQQLIIIIKTKINNLILRPQVKLVMLSRSPMMFYNPD
jgi:hypothetical protein